MFEFLQTLFGTKTDYKELVKNGAQIIDVRSKNEFSGGSVKGAVNIPLDVLRANFSKIKKDKPVITCCASGMRSASAKSILKGSGYTEVYNGGGWMSLRQKI